MKYLVSLQVFMAGGEDIGVTAMDEAEAVHQAKKILRDMVSKDQIEFTLEEITVTSCEEIKQ